MPDLELDTAGGAPSGGGLPFGADGGSFGDPFDDGLDASLPLPEVEMPAPARRASSSRGAPGARAAPGSPPTAAGAAPRTKPQGASPPSPPTEAPLDPRSQAEMLRIADYGPAPDGIVGTIPYAIHVFNRRRHLRAAHADGVRVRQSAETAAEQALVAVGRALLQQADSLDSSAFARELEVARQAAGESHERSAAHAQTKEGIAAELEAFDTRIRELAAEIDPWRDRETKLATQHQVKDTDFKRAVARLRRIEIELRNVGPDSTAPDPSRVPLLEADRDARRAEMRLAEGPALKLAEELSEVRRELAARMAAVSRTEAEKSRLQQALRQSESTQQVHLSAAQKDLEATLRALAEAAREQDADAAAGEALVRRADNALELWTERQRIEDLHWRALSAYDKPSFQRGAAVLGGAALIIFVMIVLVIFT